MHTGLDYLREVLVNLLHVSSEIFHFHINSLFVCFFFEIINYVIECDIYMEFLFSILILFLFISFSSSLNNLTYVLTNTNASYIPILLRSNGLILTNTSYVTRLLSTSDVLLANTQTLIAGANNSQSIVFVWDTGDCSYPSASAKTYSTKYISSPICFSQGSSYNNLLQLTVTTAQLGQAAASFMNSYSLHDFSMILTDSNSFYSNLAQEFSSYLTQKSYIFERTIFVSNFSSSAITSLKSRG